MLIASYAKINLFLELLGHLPDGFHQVNTVLCSIDLFDELRFTLTKSGTVKVWSQLPELNTNENLICKVANYLRQRFGIEDGVDIRLNKRIPIAAGLGGGSSNAAITLIALNKLWQLSLSEKEMHGIAAIFGSDINFFLTGGTALGENRGERISPQADILIDNILLVKPGLSISAGTAYGASELPANGETKLFDPLRPVATMFNRLERGVRERYPSVDSILRELEAFGATKSMLSGSGPTCIGIFEEANGLAKCQSHFKRMGYFTQQTQTIARGEYQKCFPS